MGTKHDHITDSLTREILSGRYQAGDRLPSERDLADRFDTNRGAVREAMKCLAQMGLASIQPGGARVAPLQEASLDVIGHMLKQSDLPDPQLVDQILKVVNSLVTMAVEDIVDEGSDADIETLRAQIAPLHSTNLSHEEHNEARANMIRAFMITSGNLVCQLIARTLFEQFAPNMAPLKAYVQIDHPAYSTYALQLDRALLERDRAAVRTIFNAFADLNRQTFIRAFDAIRADLLEAEANHLKTKVAIS
jgi:DNA-binding FadR family transcriptional regulator|tara:strand:+ start:480 stop:1226 length:747 start_codon:yes stop_codon:yes gene_type:complete